MSDLGEFGTAHEPWDATFTYFGRPIRVNPDLSEVRVLRLVGEVAANEAGQGEDTAANAKALAALNSMVALLVHPDDLETFWTTAEANRQRATDLAELAAKLIEALTDRPFESPSDSSPSPPPTATTSAGDSSSPALRMLANRPDLAVAVLHAEEARRAEASA